MAPTEASVFFLDIAGFTALTETVETEFLVKAITKFFSDLSNVVVRHRGVVDKYIGDCIMAFWNTPEKVNEHQLLACAAAVDCEEVMQSFDYHGLELKARVGIEAGHVYAGMFGSPYRVNYTVVGDVVNVASRLEGLNKEVGTTVLIGPLIHEKVRDLVNARRMPPLEVKGKKQKLITYELLSLNVELREYIDGMLLADVDAEDAPGMSPTSF